MLSNARDAARSSFFNSIPFGTSICVFAKFQIALMPESIKRSTVDCANLLGVAIIPIFIFRR